MDARRSPGTAARVVAAAVMMLASVAVAMAPPGGASVCAGDIEVVEGPRDDGPPLRFGVTAAGRVFRNHPQTDDPERILSALDTLRGDQSRPFVVRLNRFMWQDGASGIARFVDLARRYTDGGFAVDLQLRYQPERVTADPDAFALWVRDVVRALGPNPGVVSLQVTNETNLSAPDNSDGAYSGAIDAMVRGVIAADDEIRALGYDHLEVGFSWFYRVAPDEETFWHTVGERGGAAFRAALDWVGLSAYPGTYFPRVSAPGSEGRLMVHAAGLLRECYMPLAGLGPQVPIRVSENGYPTGWYRDQSLQPIGLESMVRAVDATRRRYNVTDYSWFTLWDARNALDFESGYGLLRNDFSPKASFETYRRLIDELG